MPRMTKAQLEDELAQLHEDTAAIVEDNQNLRYRFNAFKREARELVAERQYWVHVANAWRDKNLVQADAIVSLALSHSELERRLKEVEP